MVREEFEALKEFTILDSEFEHYVGRKPKDVQEFENWAHYVFKGIEAQIDWSVAMKCASEQPIFTNMRSGADGAS